MRRVKITSLIVYALFFITYLFPIRFFTEITGLEMGKILFLVVCLFSYAAYVCHDKSLDPKELLALLLIIIVAFAKHSIEPLVLIEYLLLFRILKKDSGSIQIPDKLLLLSCLGITFYSILYFGKLQGFLCTGYVEQNQSAFSIFFLFLIIYKRNKKIGSILLLIGVLTLSRNYLLCLAVFFICKGKISHKLYKVLSFKKMVIISLALLALLSYSFEVAYKNNMLSESYSDIRRYTHIYDYSNYFRFSTNFDLIELYARDPAKLLSGFGIDEFMNLRLRLAKEKERPYRAILPHNYFFAYFRIYGIFCIFIFLFLDKIVNLVATKDNFIILLLIFIYANVLGAGFANFFLFLTIFTMHEYKVKAKKKEATI